MLEPRFRVHYWPFAFRGCFVTHLLSYREQEFELVDFEEVASQRRLNPKEQKIPFMGPPLLEDKQTGLTLSQMPAILDYLGNTLDFAPKDKLHRALCSKVVMDCNDVLMEICRYNGSQMWNRSDWKSFRNERLPHWLAIFEESIRRGTLGQTEIHFADLATFALWANMMRCLPELETDIEKQAPNLVTLIGKVQTNESLQAFLKIEEEKFGNLYCGGHIEKSIRQMLKEDSR
ncbi:MAG: glutathione S-transferase family protein [Pseudomonadota bacterium]